VAMRERLRILIHGAVQGVGFRPFVYRVARDLALDGWVLNSAQGVVIEVEGVHAALEACLGRISTDTPPRAVLQSMESAWLDPVGYDGFEIRRSDEGGAATTLVLPDVAICDDCRAEILTMSDRRYRYPFTNCTNCGPRFSIIDALPYDRANTSMRGFRMCPACEREYHDPLNRRFHAQPNACPDCGPQLALWNADGQALEARDAALRRAAAEIRAGRIVAVKGLGGFHLMADARRPDAVQRLRDRKRRSDKPFALMYPSLDLVRQHCSVSAAESRLLASPEAPIVLLRRLERAAREIAVEVAPGVPTLGIMLPYTPLHVLLMSEIGGPVVATSGNVSDEPMCIDEREAVERLWGIADEFLVHDRPIVRHVDDSIVRVVLDREMVLRRARGYAPLPVPLPQDVPPLLGVGAHLKNAVALTSGANVFISQHIGDLETRESFEAFFATLSSFEQLYRTTPTAVVADLHPDYLSTQYAESLGLPVLQVQHHYAHIASCMLENDLQGSALGVAWDGTGYGTDGTIWGGEFLAIDDASFRRAAALRPFRLPGGARAVREPRRSALGVLYEMFGEGAWSLQLPTLQAFTAAEARLLLQALRRSVNTPVTTSAGRLFDAVASLAGLRQRATYEGQAAVELESAADPAIVDRYAFELHEPSASFIEGPGEAPDVEVDWTPTIRGVIDDVRLGVAASTIAARFHNTLAEMIVMVAARVGEPRVVLSGGCFQNALLLERVVCRLREAGFRPYWHQRVPPNDGGIALGQIGAFIRQYVPRHSWSHCQH